MRESTRLQERIDKLADLAAEHVSCTGCPTPWWLTDWLMVTAADAPSDGEETP